MWAWWRYFVGRHQAQVGIPMAHSHINYQGYRVDIAIDPFLAGSKVDIGYVVDEDSERFVIRIPKEIWDKAEEQELTDALLTGLRYAVQEVIAERFAPLN